MVFDIKLKYHVIISILLIMALPILHIWFSWNFYGGTTFYTLIGPYQFFIVPFLIQIMNFLLYLGSISLDRDKRGFIKIKLLRIYSIVLIISQPFIPSVFPEISLAYIILQLSLSIFYYITFFLVGISNRAQYGNYLVSATLLSVTSGIINWINVFIGGIDMLFGIQYGSFFTSAMFLTGVLGSTYILFFGLRIRNIYYFV